MRQRSGDRQRSGSRRPRISRGKILFYVIAVFRCDHDSERRAPAAGRCEHKNLAAARGAQRRRQNKQKKNSAKRLHAALKRRLDEIARTQTGQKALRIRPRHDDDKPKNGPHKARARASPRAPNASRPTAVAAAAAARSSAGVFF